VSGLVYTEHIFLMHSQLKISKIYLLPSLCPCALACNLNTAEYIFIKDDIGESIFSVSACEKERFYWDLI
jgi:hypothetical protein